MSALRISAVTVTPVAFADPPLLNSVGVHEPFALRAVVEVRTDDGLSGLGETYADERHLAALRAAAGAIVGADAYHTEQIYRRVRAIAAPDTPIASGLIGDSSATDRVFSPFEVACLDIQGQAAGRPVADLLGGAVRDEVPFSAYLFYKWAAHPGAEPDDWGEALDPGGIVAQARRMVGDRLELSRAQMNVVFVTILLGLLLSALDQAIVSTALPTIVGDLGGAGHVSWVVTAYMHPPPTATM